jgi:hypothetical protein
VDTGQRYGTIPNSNRKIVDTGQRYGTILNSNRKIVDTGQRYEGLGVHLKGTGSVEFLS